MSIVVCYLIAVLVAVTPTTLFAESFNLDCTRTHVDASAYTDADAADSWHPKQVALRINDDDVYFDEMLGEVRREGSRYKFDFIVVSEGNAAGALYRPIFTYIPRTGVYTYIITAPGGYRQGAGSGGRCVQR